MKLTFRIKYCTVWGESLRVIINNDEKNSLALFTRDGQEWQGTRHGIIQICRIQK